MDVLRWLGLPTWRSGLVHEGNKRRAGIHKYAIIAAAIERKRARIFLRLVRAGLALKGIVIHNRHVNL
jgi:hypothetical protein